MEPRTLLRTSFLAFSLMATTACGGCGGGGETPGVSSADVLTRERAAALFAEKERRDAFDLIAPLASRPDATLDDLVHGISVALDPAVSQVELARGWQARAEAIDPEDLRVRWAQFRFASIDFEWDEAEGILRAIHEDAPGDIPTKLALGNILSITENATSEEIEQLYLDVIAVGPDFAASWYKAAAHRLFRLLIETGRAEEAEQYGAIHSRMADQGVKSPSPEDTEVGNFGSLPAPVANQTYPRSDIQGRTAPGWVLGEASRQADVAVGVRGVHVVLEELRLTTTDSSISPEGGNLGWVFGKPQGPESLLVWGDNGMGIARWTGDAWEVESIFTGAVHAAAGFDLGDPRYFYLDHPAHAGDGDIDLVAATDAGLILFVRDEGAWTQRPEPIATYATPPRAILAVDFDHEGDVDLLLVGDDGATVLRNDGAHEEGGAFVDVTGETAIPRGANLAWAVAEDLDHDNDVDLLYGGPGGVHHASNERGGVFTDVSSKLPDGLAGGVRAGDRDGDGWPDLTAADGAVWRSAPSGAWLSIDADTRPPGPAVLGEDAFDVPFGAVVCDKEGDGVPDVVELDGDALVTRAGTLEGGATTMRLHLHGELDNARGLGAVVEIILGSSYRRVYWRGGSLEVATHGKETIDVVRVTWPNGVIQSLIDIPGTGDAIIKQRPGLAGSCPFLYTWDGERFVFITDVLGITPLGLPMAPGMMVPPDHDEYVLVRGDRMKPKDGEFVIQITEELREVTYLDRVRLDVIDHPADVEVFPNERFSFPPFPEHHVHTMKDALAPTDAIGSDGEDWTAELAEDDEHMAYPFEALGGQFQGLANPWFVELTFDADAVRNAKKLRLALNGWLFWTNASVNMAAAGHPTIEFIPPILQVPDGEGGWKEAGVLGFPAGKLKTMVVDVTDAIVREDPRIRVFSSLELYWDSIRLAVDPDDAPFVTTSIEPSSAELWLRGFSKPLPHPNHHALENFDWDELDEPRWNQHPGSYTKLGPCRELIDGIDDRFCILGAGDALTVKFPADDLPPLPEGWTRDYLIFFDGWAKDRDLNTKEALYVEPLPFHGMSGYPYGPDESFPDTPEHRAWRKEWNTRESLMWVEPLAPMR